MADSFWSENRAAGPGILSVDSLARAIGEVREELLTWIDAELSRLRDLQREEDRSMKAASGGSGATRLQPRDAGMVLPPTVRDGGGPATTDEIAGMGRGMTRSGGWSDDRDSNADVDEPPRVARGSGMDLEPRSAPGDPGERLDALARRLDHRLKQAAGAPKVPPATTADGGKDMPGETRYTSPSRTVGWSSRGDSTAEGGQ